MAICEVCGTDYPSKRADSKCCGPTCRSRARRATDNNATLNPPTDATLNVDFRLDDETVETDTQAPAPLPACVPDIIRERYNREGAEYRATIDRLVSTSIDDLLAAGVYVPVWRYQAGNLPARVTADPSGYAPLAIEQRQVGF